MIMKLIQSDTDADYHSKYNYDVSEIEPLVAKPHSPDNRDYRQKCSGNKTN